ncbi:hypothetical protein NSU18_10225 [Paenibacillus sp. FSL H8-0048]
MLHKDMRKFVQFLKQWCANQAEGELHSLLKIVVDSYFSDDLVF